jgi:hypothetical protein
MYHTPLTWYEQESLGHKARFEACPEPSGFCVSSGCKLDHKDTARRPYGPVRAFTKPVTRRF